MTMLQEIGPMLMSQQEQAHENSVSVDLIPKSTSPPITPTKKELNIHNQKVHQSPVADVVESLRESIMQLKLLHSCSDKQAAGDPKKCNSSYNFDLDDICAEENERNSESDIRKYEHNKNDEGPLESENESSQLLSASQFVTALNQSIDVSLGKSSFQPVDECLSPKITSSGGFMLPKKSDDAKRDNEEGIVNSGKDKPNTEKESAQEHSESCDSEYRSSKHVTDSGERLHQVQQERNDLQKQVVQLQQEAEEMKRKIYDLTMIQCGGEPLPASPSQASRSTRNELPDTSGTSSLFSPSSPSEYVFASTAVASFISKDGRHMHSLSNISDSSECGKDAESDEAVLTHRTNASSEMSSSSRSSSFLPSLSCTPTPPLPTSTSENDLHPGDVSGNVQSSSSAGFDASSMQFGEISQNNTGHLQLPNISMFQSNISAGSEQISQNMQQDKEVARLRQRIDSLTKLLAEAEEKAIAAEAQNSASRTELNEMRERLRNNTAMEEEFGVLKRENERLEKDLDRKSKEMKHLEEELQKAKKKLETKKENSKMNDKTETDGNFDVDDAPNDLCSLKSNGSRDKRADESRTALEAALHAAQQVKALREKLADKEASLEREVEANEALRMNMEILNSRLTVASGNLKNSEEEKMKMQRMLMEVEEKMKIKEKEREADLQHAQKMEEEIRQLKEQTQQFEEREEERTKEMDAERQKYADELKELNDKSQSNKRNSLNSGSESEEENFNKNSEECSEDDESEEANQKRKHKETLLLTIQNLQNLMNEQEKKAAGDVQRISDEMVAQKRQLEQELDNERKMRMKEEEERAIMSEEKEELNKEIENIRKERKELEEELERISNELMTGKENEENDKRKSENCKKERETAFVEQLSTLTDKIKELENQRNAAEREIRDLIDKLNERDNLLQKAKDEIMLSARENKLISTCFVNVGWEMMLKYREDVLDRKEEIEKIDEQEYNRSLLTLPSRRLHQTDNGKIFDFVSEQKSDNSRMQPMKLGSQKLQNDFKTPSTQFKRSSIQPPSNSTTYSQPTSFTPSSSSFNALLSQPASKSNSSLIDNITKQHISPYPNATSQIFQSSLVPSQSQLTALSTSSLHLIYKNTPKINPTSSLPVNSNNSLTSFPFSSEASSKLSFISSAVSSSATSVQLPNQERTSQKSPYVSAIHSQSALMNPTSTPEANYSSRNSRSIVPPLALRSLSTSRTSSLPSPSSSASSASSSRLSKRMAFSSYHNQTSIPSSVDLLGSQHISPSVSSTVTSSASFTLSNRTKRPASPTIPRKSFNPPACAVMYYFRHGGDISFNLQAPMNPLEYFVKSRNYYSDPETLKQREKEQKEREEMKEAKEMKEMKEMKMEGEKGALQSSVLDSASGSSSSLPSSLPSSLSLSSSSSLSLASQMMDIEDLVPGEEKAGALGEDSGAKGVEMEIESKP
ncbi:uncharacterized protein MONOS_15094 [Monocercomonoides exilis]|uniref:uncharacterized protein n=1 Tax=Monocercomonoides exilis TaxID=2049356 RepID=UPI00355AAB67|nr:hypothetical protein MONOS_15094 [Monocercomonoides exilis]|eukprot:MONOS_15094.1-p1 / transcript=MONOS_15094.1 / gene=MONOS_15094 / organism=Monocercomonoides_exilis_PA203 / gene_product=unspecified product / transcript_product=unspecified product / location=Mono_scaffold01142:9557-14061(+) / protein_length=1436 / sequence_SO=supercontig / SO=protein_coding / is_pseudo=false